MQKKLVRPFVMVVLALVVLAGCKKAADLAKYKEQAMSLAAQYGPQLKELLGKVDGLSARAKALPVNIPGVDAVTKTLENNKGALAKLQGMIDQLPGKATEAVKGGKKAEVEALISSTTTEVGGGITTIGNDVAAAEKTIGELEVKAKEQAAAEAAAAAAAAAAPTDPAAPADPTAKPADPAAKPATP